MVLVMVAFVALPPYFLRDFGLAWDRALPATDLVLGLVRPLRSKVDALLATACEVCLGFDFAIFPPPYRHLLANLPTQA